MTEHKPSTRGATRATLCTLAALVALALCGAFASAQSGRKGARPAATPTPEATPQGESESESKPRQAKPTDVTISFAVMEMDNAIINIDMMARDDLIETFFRRLGQARTVAVSRAGKGGRKEARERAKKEEQVYVVLFELEEENAIRGEGSVGGRVDSRTLLIKTYVYAPKTGDLKYADTIMQRPYRETTSIGGVRIPVPSRRIEQYPSQLQLEQAARDAADRLMSRFGIMPPRDN